MQLLTTFKVSVSTVFTQGAKIECVLCSSALHADFQFLFLDRFSFSLRTTGAVAELELEVNLYKEEALRKKARRDELKATLQSLTAVYNRLRLGTNEETDADSNGLKRKATCIGE